MSVKNLHARKLQRMRDKKDARRTEKNLQKAARNGQRFATPRHQRHTDDSPQL